MIIDTKLYKLQYEQLVGTILTEINLDQFYQLSQNYIKAHNNPHKYDIKNLIYFCQLQNLTSFDLDSAKEALELFTLSIDLNVPFFFEREGVEPSQWKKDVQRSLLKNIEYIKKDIESQQSDFLKIEKDHQDKENNLVSELDALNEKYSSQCKEYNRLVLGNEKMKAEEAALELKYSKLLSNNTLLNESIKKLEASNQKNTEVIQSMEEKTNNFEVEINVLESKMKKIKTKIQGLEAENEKLLEEASVLSNKYDLKKLQEKLEFVKNDNIILETEHLDLVNKMAQSGYGTSSFISTRQCTLNLKDMLENSDSPGFSTDSFQS